MNLDEFISEYDHNGMVLLFFGKRKLPLKEAVKIRELGILLASKTKHITFRTGHALGADDAFGVGVAEVDIDRIQLILPNNGHRSRYRIGYTFRSIDDLIMVNEDKVIYWAKKHETTRKLVDRYLEGKRDRTTPKVAPIIRDAVMVVGHENIAPTNVAVYWDDPNKPEEGGTGYTISILDKNNIVAFGQHVWGGWLSVS